MLHYILTKHIFTQIPAAVLDVVSVVVVAVVGTERKSIESSHMLYTFYTHFNQRFILTKHIFSQIPAVVLDVVSVVVVAIVGSERKSIDESSHMRAYILF